MATIAQSLRAARASGLDRLDADLLLLHASGIAPAQLNQRRSWLLAHDDDELAPTVDEHFCHLVQRRLAGEPLAYIVGHKEFHGLDLLVDSRVLVPRPDTEILVEWALACVDALTPREPQDPHRLLDLGTGSGAIALALRHARPQLLVDAVDASAPALALARDNASRLGLQLQWLHGSWFEPVTGSYDCIVSNPPYIRQDDPHLPALAHEPVSALTSGHDGLHDLRIIIAGATQHLRPGGWLLLEHGFDQGPQVHALLQGAGYQNLGARHDLAGHWRCSGGQWASAGTGQEQACVTRAAGR